MTVRPRRIPSVRLVTAAVLFLGLGPGLLAGCQDEESRKASVRQELYKELQPVKLSNCTFERYGESYDGGYLVCGNLLAGTEAAYSYGISGYDEWGCDASRQLRVTTHEYDCFNTTKPDCPDGRTEFHAECVAAAPLTDGGRVFDTLEHQIARNGDKGRRLVVKMDVEGAEWDSLGTAPEAVLEQMGQLVVEFHDVVDPKFLATVRRLKRYFHVAHIHYNNWVCEEKTRPFPSFAYEVLFVSKKLGVVDAGGRVTLPNPLDSPNNPGEPDCQTAAP